MNAKDVPLRIDEMMEAAEARRDNELMGAIIVATYAARLVMMADKYKIPRGEFGEIMKDLFFVSKALDPRLKKEDINAALIALREDSHDILRTLQGDQDR